MTALGFLTPRVGNDQNLAANGCRGCLALLFEDHVKAIGRTALSYYEFCYDKSSSQRAATAPTA